MTSETWSDQKIVLYAVWAIFKLKMKGWPISYQTCMDIELSTLLYLIWPKMWHTDWKLYLPFCQSQVQSTYLINGMSFNNDYLLFFSINNSDMIWVDYMYFK